MNKLQKKLKIRSGDAILVGDLYTPERSKKKAAIIIETGLALNRKGIFTEFAKFFADKGFPAFVYDKRSHNESTGRFRCDQLSKDLRNVIRHLTKQHHFKKFGLLGFCYGNIPIIEAAQDEQQVKVICGINPYTNYFELFGYKNNQISFRHHMFHNLGLTLYKLKVRIPFDHKDFHIAPVPEGTGYHGNLSQLFKELAECRSAIGQVRLLKKPFHIFYGSRDRLVPIEEVKRIFNDCPSKDKQLHIYDQAGHFFEKQRQEMLSDCLSTFQKHL